MILCFSTPKSTKILKHAHFTCSRARCLRRRSLRPGPGSCGHGRPHALARQGLAMASSRHFNFLAVVCAAALVVRHPEAQSDAPSFDACGCRGGSGWSITTGRGCCKPGSITQASEQDSCRAYLGNTDCTPMSGAYRLADDESPGAQPPLQPPLPPPPPPPPPPLPAVENVAGGATSAAYRFDACGCVVGSGWSVTTGRGCCMPGACVKGW